MADKYHTLEVGVPYEVASFRTPAAPQASKRQVRNLIQVYTGASGAVVGWELRHDGVVVSRGAWGCRDSQHRLHEVGRLDETEPGPAIEVSMILTLESGYAEARSVRTGATVTPKD